MYFQTTSGSLVVFNSSTQPSIKQANSCSVFCFIPLGIFFVLTLFTTFLTDSLSPCDCFISTYTRSPIRGCTVYPSTLNKPMSSVIFESWSSSLVSEYIRPNNDSIHDLLSRDKTQNTLAHCLPSLKGKNKPHESERILENESSSKYSPI